MGACLTVIKNEDGNLKEEYKMNCPEGDIVCFYSWLVGLVRKLYTNELNNYYNLYNKYIEYKTDTSADKQWKISYAENTIRNQIERSRSDLNELLRYLQKATVEMSNNVDKTKLEVNSSSGIIREKTSLLNELNTNIEIMSMELESKQRQVSFTEERTRSRKITTIVLVIVNLLFVALFYYYFIMDFTMDSGILPF